jgi:hypothetical protein
LPRFYFNVRDGSTFSPDEEGDELDGLDAAEREAAEVAAMLGRDRLPKRDARRVTVEVRNEHRQLALIVTVSMVTQRMDLQPPRE